MIYLVLTAAGFLAALVSGAAGFGGSLLLLPVVTLCVGADRAVPVLTIAQLIGNLSRMAAGFRQIAWKPVGWFCLTALPLAALGALGFSVLPKTAVTRCIGAALIVLVYCRLTDRLTLRGDRRTLLLGGAVTGGVSGLAGSGGPIGAAVFLSLDLAPVAYIASEAATATAMHVLKIVVYAKLAALDGQSLLTGLLMGAAMIGGTVAAKRLIEGMDKARFQRYVAVLLCAVGAYMLLAG